MSHLLHLPRLPPLVHLLHEAPGGGLLLGTELRRPWPRGLAHHRLLLRLWPGHHCSRSDHRSDPSPQSSPPEGTIVVSLLTALLGTKRKLDNVSLFRLSLNFLFHFNTITCVTSLLYSNLSLWLKWLRVSCLRYIFRSQVCIIFKRQSLVSRYSALAHRLATAILDICVQSDCTGVYQGVHCTSYWSIQ